MVVLLNVRLLKPTFRLQTRTVVHVGCRGGVDPLWLCSEFWNPDPLLGNWYSSYNPFCSECAVKAWCPRGVLSSEDNACRGWSAPEISSHILKINTCRHEIEGKHEPSLPSFLDQLVLLLLLLFWPKWFIYQWYPGQSHHADPSIYIVIYLLG